MSVLSAPSWQLSSQELQNIAAKVLKGQLTQDKPAGKSSDAGHAQDAPDKETTGPDWQLDPVLWQEIQRVVPKEVPQGQLPIQVGTIDGGIKVMLVDGDRVMVEHDMDFIAGGNGAEAPEFIPKDEIWIDANMVPREFPFNCYHEAHERRLMANQGMEYAHAHERANHVEKQLRIQAMNQQGFSVAGGGQDVEKSAGKGGDNSAQPSAGQREPAQPSANPDDTRNLAETYAQMWNDFVAAGMPPSEHEIAEVDAELEGSEWKLQQGEDGLWTVVPMVETVAVQQYARHTVVLQFAAMRAPYGTRSNPFHAVDKNGQPKDYLKGQFIPGGAVEKLKEAASKGDAASQSAVAQLEGAAAGHEATRQKNMQARQQRDLSKLKGRLSTHAQSQPLDAGMEKSAAYSFRALKRYHGDLLTHRLDELSEQVESRLAKVDKDLARTAEGTAAHSKLMQTRQKLTGMMAKFNRVHQLAVATEQQQQVQQPQESPAPTPANQPQAVAGEKEPADHTETVSGSEKPQGNVAATAPGAALAPKKPTQPQEAQRPSINLNDSKMLAAAIHNVGATLPDAISGDTNNGNLPVWQSHKPLLSDVYQALKPQLGGATLSDFKNAVWNAHKNGDLELNRNDLPAAVKGDRTLERIRESEIAPYGNSMATFHHVNTNSSAARRQSQPQQPPEQPREDAKPASQSSYEPAESKPVAPSSGKTVEQEETPATREPEEKPLEIQKPKEEESKNPILSHFSARKPRSFQEISKRAGLDKSQAAQQIKQLLKEGKVQAVSDENGDRYVLSPEKSATAAPAKEPPPKPPAPATKPMPPSKNPPPPKPAPPTAPQPKKLSTNPAEIQKQAQDYQMSPERLKDLEAFAARREKTGDAAGAQMYRQKAEQLRAWLVEHNRMPEEQVYNPGVHEREKPNNEGMSRLADVMAGKKHAPERERPIILQNLSPEAQKVVADEQQVEQDKSRGRGRPGKNKILKAAQQLSQMKAQLASKNPVLDKKPEASEDEPNPGQVTMRQRLQELANQVEYAIANRDVAALKKLRFQREAMMAVLQFIRTGA